MWSPWIGYRSHQHTMNTFISRRRVTLLLSGLILFGLASCASDKTPPPVSPTAHTTHTITIHYDTVTKQWDYTIVPAGDAKKARVKRHDTILWKCDAGSWTVYFKGPTPLTNPADPCEGDVGYVSGAKGATAGAQVSRKVRVGDEFTYGVSVLLPGATEPVVDDPRIFIER